MSLLSRIKQKAFSELIDTIEWTDDTNGSIIWRYPRNKGVFKNGAQLAVSKNQVAVLMCEGLFADIYQPGQYELTPTNMPVLSSLKGWKHGCKSSLKIDVYFINTKQHLDMRWGTLSPIMMSDPVVGPVCIRAFGTYFFSINPNPIKFIRNVVAADGSFTAESISNELRNFSATKFTEYLKLSKITPLDLLANLNEFSCELTIALKEVFFDYGINLSKFLIESISMPKTVEETLNNGATIDCSDSTLAYTQIIAADAMVDKAINTLETTHQQDIAASTSQQTMYYVAVRGVRQGPFTQTQMLQMVHLGELTRNTPVWTQGMEGWQAAKSVSQLSPLFSTVPPPL